MVNLKVRTEYTFREVFGPIEKVLKATAGPIGICDRNGTWGHVAFENACVKAKRKFILGAELAVVDNAKLREKQGTNYMSFLARNDKGLRELYELVTLSTAPENFYYTPRIDYNILSEVSDNLIVFSGANPVWSRLPKLKNLYVELNPASPIRNAEHAGRLPVIATSDNFYPTIADKRVYEVISGRFRQTRTTPMHLLSEGEWFLLGHSRASEALANQQAVADACDAKLPKATMVHFTDMPSLRSICEKAAKSRGVNLKDKAYSERLKRELDLITEKKFEDYFYLVSDIVSFAKKHMLVGPARGSSCGSLVCYLMGITEVDPIPYGLLFERFIDINRKDLPDIDIDFPDDRREMVFDYIHIKYGQECSARLGTILRYKAKSAITDVAKELGIPAYGMVEDLKNAIIERSTGDARAAFCIADTFNDLEIGRQVIAKYPALRIAGEIENHAKSSGQHAAGVVVTADPVARYCSVDQKTGAAQVDKKDAESLNLLKIDALGLRTLSILQDCLDQVGWEKEKLVRYPTDDEEAFAILNQGKFTGIFQFEGYALQSLCTQMTVENFEDIASLTALARPGPLNSGGATEFIRRRNGEVEVSHLHKLIAHTTQITYGVVIYQEQVMQIAREMGQLSWEDVSSLRKAMSKSLGKEFFDGFWERFKVGAAKQGVNEEDANRVWVNINTMGSWSFNRSHAVAYGLVSYWSLVLKSKFPLEFATACLRSARDNDQGIQLLRELHKEGFRYKAFDPELSEKTWAVKDGLLIGGLTNVKGIGDKIADEIISRRQRGEPLSAGQRNKLANGTTPFDTIFECEECWGHIKREPERFNIRTAITDIGALTQDDDGLFLIMGKIKAKDLRDLNDNSSLQKREGRRINGQANYLNVTVEDDTGSIIVCVDRHHYITWGIPLVEKAKIGDWLMFKGNLKKGFRRMYCTRWKRLEDVVESS